MNKTTRFAIMGSGGVGGYFGACLARSGFPVTFIARGAHLEAIRKNGLEIHSPAESFRVNAPATDQTNIIGHVDFVLFAVKLWDTEPAAQACQHLLGPKTTVISLQNGVDSETILQSILGPEHVMGGVAEIAASIERPGHIRKIGAIQRIRFGELNGQESERSRLLGRCLSEADIDIGPSKEIIVAIWTKFIFLVGMSALTALTRKTIGAIRTDPDTRELLKQVMAETFAVAQAKGIPLGSDTVSERLRFIDSLPAEMRASMAIDLSQGRRLELPWLSGAVVRLGAELNVPTPANRFVYTALKLYANGGQSKG